MTKKPYLSKSDCTSLDFLTVKELFNLVRENPELGYIFKRVRRGGSWESQFYNIDRSGRKRRISRREAADRYITLRMQRAEEAGNFAEPGKAFPEYPEDRTTAYIEERAAVEQPSEPEPAEDELFRVYRELGITPKRNGRGVVYIQDKRDDFQSESRSHPIEVSQSYVLNAVAAYAEYQRLIESDQFEDVNKAVRLAEQYFPRPIVHEAQRKIFRVYGDNEDAGRLYENEAGIAGIDYRTNPLHASSEIERQLEIERMTMPLSAVEAAEFEREGEIKSLERLAMMDAQNLRIS